MMAMSATTRGRFLAFLLAVFPAAGGSAVAQEATPTPSLKLELNGLEPSAAGCRFTFVVQNGLGAPLQKAAFELVLFDQAGKVNRLTVLDFKDLPAGKTKVRQFDLPQTDCAGIGRVLVNDAVACEGEGIEPTACVRYLDAQAKSSVAFGS